MDSGRSRRSCTIVKQEKEVEKTKNVQTKKKVTTKPASNSNSKRPTKAGKTKTAKKSLRVPAKTKPKVPAKKSPKVPDKKLRNVAKNSPKKKAPQRGKTQTGKEAGKKDEAQKISNVVYKDATGLTSDEESEFSSESEGEWDERKTDSKGNKREDSRANLPGISSSSESDSEIDAEIPSTDEEAPGPSGLGKSIQRPTQRKNRVVRKRPAIQNRYIVPKRILVDRELGPLATFGTDSEQANMNFSETLGNPELGETSWTEAELSTLTDILDSMRAKADHIGIYGLSERQTMKIQRQLTTKSGRQIKAAVSSTLMQIKENEKITDPEKHSASFLWNELFKSIFGHDAEMKAIVEKHHDAFESFFSDKAEEVEFEDGRNREVKLAREEREIAGLPKQAEVDIPEIYRYLGALSSRKNKTLPRLNIATSALLVELLDEIEREADDVVSPNLQDELNKRYAATLTNRRYVPFLDSQRKVFQRTNKEFDEFNPLALSLEKWSEKLEGDGSTEMVDTFSMEFESPHVETS